MPVLIELLKSRSPKRDVQLIERTGLSRVRIDQLSRGAEPDLEELRLLADFFRVDLRELLPPHRSHAEVELLFRNSGNPVDEVTSSALSRRIGCSVDLLGENESSIPPWVKFFRRDVGTYESAEANAQEFRRFFFGDDQLSPILRLPEIATEVLRALVFVVRTPRFEGASVFVSGFPFIFVAETFGPRMLFTLAHEVAHLIAHHDADSAFAVVDVQTERPPHGGKNASEFYAHAFASSLLLPREGVAVTLKKIRDMQVNVNDELGDLELLLLARIYGVSFYAAARRCEDLGLLPRGGAASLTELLTKEYGSPEKRAEAANLPARPALEFPALPSLLLQAALERVRLGEMSIGKASSVLGLSIADILVANAPRAN